MKARIGMGLEEGGPGRVSYPLAIELVTCNKPETHVINKYSVTICSHILLLPNPSHSRGETERCPLRTDNQSPDLNTLSRMGTFIWGLLPESRMGAACHMSVSSFGIVQQEQTQR